MILTATRFPTEPVKDLERTLAELDAVIEAADPADRPALVVALAARLAQLGARLSSAVVVPRSQPPVRWLTPHEAAQLAGIDVKRLYDWARNKKWAVRPTRRCLRIHEADFRTWLAQQ